MPILIMDCANKERNGADCPRTDCERHGFCCDCVRYHRAKGEMPNCLH